MKKKQLRKSDIRSLNNEIESAYGHADFFSKHDTVILVEDDVSLVVRDGEPLFFYHENTLVPTLRLLLREELLRRVVVDMGAVKFVTNGADVMKPGIVEADETLREGEHAVVIDTNNKKPLAVTQLMVDASSFADSEKGKVLRNLHYVGDDIWNYTDS